VPRTVKDLEAELIDLHRKFKEAPTPKAKDEIRLRYRRIHARWLVTKNQRSLRIDA
jgi:hypothetical protein